MPLITTTNFDSPDEFYQALIDSHADLSTEQSHAMNARLVLLLANHIGRPAGVARGAGRSARSGRAGTHAATHRLGRQAPRPPVHDSTNRYATIDPT